MALFDRNNNRGYGYGDQNRGGGYVDRAQNAVRRGWDRVENAFEGQSPRNDYDRGMTRGNVGGMGAGRPMDRDGGLHQRNSWSDGAWTADAGERADREWNTGNRGRMGYDRDMNDTSPFQAGWRAGGMQNGDASPGIMPGGMGMDRGNPDRDRGWNLGGGEWGHTGNLSGNAARYDRGYSAGGGMSRGGGFLDRAQNAVRRGWENVEDRFDRDDDGRNGMHLGGGAMRGGTSWAGRYDRDHMASDVRGYRDGENHYGTAHVGGMTGGGAGMGGMNRYGSDYRAGGMDMDRGGRGYDRGYKTREQTDAGDPFGDRQNRTPIRMTNGGMGNRGGLGRYDENYRGNRDWF